MCVYVYICVCVCILVDTKVAAYSIVLALPVANERNISQELQQSLLWRSKM